jgi:isopentenyldiphosphate isomerase
MTKAIVLYEELVDIVDQNNRVIGVLPRSIARMHPAPTRTALVLLFNSKGDIMTTIVGEGKSQEGKLYLLSEKPQAGELPIKAAYRGLEEELGIHEDQIELEFLFSEHYPDSDGSSRFVFVYRGNWDGTITPSEENHSAGFVPVKNLEGIISARVGLATGLAEYIWAESQQYLKNGTH